MTTKQRLYMIRFQFYIFAVGLGIKYSKPYCCNRREQTMNKLTVCYNRQCKCKYKNHLRYMKNCSGEILICPVNMQVQRRCFLFKETF